MRMCVLAAAGVLFALAASAPAGVVQAYQVDVYGTDNVFGAGRTSPPAPGGGGGGTLPQMLQLPAVQSGAYFSLAAAFGEVSCCSGGFGSFNGPDGGSNASGNTDVNSFGGISGLTHSGKTMFLAGVFLSDEEPSGDAPPRLDFSEGADNFEELSPLLNQSFFIGDGLFFHEDSLRHFDAQKFYIPAGATRLALGFVDGFEFDGDPGFYNDNTGFLTVVLGVVPTPGAASLLGAAGLMGLRRRR